MKWFRFIEKKPKINRYFVVITSNAQMKIGQFVRIFDDENGERNIYLLDEKSFEEIEIQPIADQPLIHYWAYLNFRTLNKFVIVTSMIAPGYRTNQVQGEAILSKEDFEELNSGENWLKKLKSRENVKWD